MRSGLFDLWLSMVDTHFLFRKYFCSNEYNIYESRIINVNDSGTAKKFLLQAFISTHIDLQAQLLMALWGKRGILTFMSVVRTSTAFSIN